MPSLPFSGNGLTIDDGTADLEFYDGYGIWGFRLASLSPVTESRGDGFAGQIASGGQNFDDATPFKRKVYDNWLGGFGQLNDNKTTGGVGIGGDDTKFFYADAKTDRAGYLMPGMARNFIYNTKVNQTVPVSGKADPNPGDEDEVPRGVLAQALSSEYRLHNSFNWQGGAVTLTKIRILFQLKNHTLNTPYTITVTLKGPLGIYSTDFTYTFTPSTTYNTLNGWCWVTLTGSATISNSVFDLYFGDSSTSATGAIGAVGVYVGNVDAGGNIRTYQPIANPTTTDNAIRPYFQLCKPGTAAPYKAWSQALRKVHQIYDTATATYFDVAVLNTSLFNTAATATGGTSSGVSPEVVFTFPYLSSIVFNSNLYVSFNDGGLNFGVSRYTPAILKANAITAPSTDLTFSMLSPVALGGYIYFFERTGRQMYKWTGNFPATGADAPIAVTAAGIVGESLVGATKLFVFQGNLWVAKPEGMFMLYVDPAIMAAPPNTNTPRVLPMGDPFPVPHRIAGAYTTIHQGKIYTNYKDRLYEFTIGADNGVQVQVIPLPMPWYQLGYYHQIDGIASDGINLYVSYNNLGIFTYNNLAWHVVTEYYETNPIDNSNAGLSWVMNPTFGPDYLYARDGGHILKIPQPNAASPYTRQIALSDQNKCGYLVVSLTNFEAAEIPKYVHSVVLSMLPGTFRVLVRPVVHIPRSATDLAGPSPSPANLVMETYHEGLLRPFWTKGVSVLNVNPTDLYVATKELNTNGTLIDGTYGPTYWDSTDFTNNVSSEKVAYLWDKNKLTTANPEQAYDDLLTHPNVFTQAGFVVYFWNPVLAQHSTVGQEIVAIDSLVVKYQSVQDYLALYKLSINVSEHTEGRKADLDGYAAEDSWEWLRNQFTRHLPILIKLKVRELPDPNLPGGGEVLNQINNTATRQFLGFLQNPSNQYGQPIVVKDSGSPLPTRVDFEIVAVDGENYGF